MNGIIFEHVHKAFGDTTVVSDLNLTVREGERLVLLGPSGCGKTTTLRMIAGLEEITAGVLKMGGQVVNAVEPGNRNVAMVFQNYALYPHMTVWENITFGLAIRKTAKSEIKSRTDKALQILNLSGYEQRKPKELSGGQKQRVALARALVKQAPFFLLDEPLSNLDAQLRLQARTELVNIHELTKPTMVYVTHDQVEAMTVGQRIAIMNKGILQQLDCPDEIYRHPANTFVASFIGAPPMNLLQGAFRDGALWISGARLDVPPEWKELLVHHSRLTLGIRPEDCRLSDTSPLHVHVELVERLGSHFCVHMRLTQDGQKVLYLLPADHPLPEGKLGLGFAWKCINIFDCNNGSNIGHPALLSRAQAC